MTPTERKVLRALDHALRISKRARARVDAARAELGGACTHPPKARAPFRWEHDNGYGRQHMRDGLRCRLCGAENHFPGLGDPGRPGAWTRPDWVVA